MLGDKLKAMNKKVPFNHLSGIFLISFATLLLELALTRVLSVSLWYHFGFLIISTALLGFGAAGVTLSVSTRLRERSDLDKTLAGLCIGFALSTILSFWLMQQIPFDPFSLLSDTKQLLYMPLYYVVVLTPFYFSGLVIGLLLTRSDSSVNRLYALDLLGAGLGCIAIVLVMPQFGGSGSISIAAAFGALAAVVFAQKQNRSFAMVSAVLVMGLITLSFFADRALPIRTSANKAQRLKTLTPMYSAWNTFSKIDVYDFAKDSIRPAQRLIIIDGGTAATGMVDMTMGVDQIVQEAKANPTARQKVSDPRTEIAALGTKKPKVLIIGAGAGDEILESVIIGASSITAVELNPIIVDIQTRRQKEYWGGLYDRPEIKLVVDEGRNFVKRSTEKYDVIISSHTISNAAVSSGALSLAENYVLTREAIEDYLDHLTPDGVLFFTRPEIQIPRLFTTATEILRERGIPTPADHMYAFSRSTPRDQKEKHKFLAGFLLKRSPLSESQVAFIRSTIHIGEEPLNPGFEYKELYSPGVTAAPASIYQEIVHSKNLNELYSRYDQLLAPATDDKPFFNQHVKWSSVTWADFQDIFTQNERGRLALEDKPIAEITLVIILLQSVLIAAILILIPLWKFSRQGLQVKGTWKFLVYFAGLGVGFILIEIALLQRFNLYLGQPVYTYAVILAGLLIFTGIGSFVSERFEADPKVILTRIIPLILGVMIFTAILLPFVFDATLQLPLVARICIAMVLVAPLGIVLGMPFPIGLRMIGKESQALAPWAWGVNGFFTVIGSVSAIILGMAFGFTAVLVTAALVYSLAGVVVGYKSSIVREPLDILERQKVETV